ncbi:sporulation YhaL family protein [Aquibacillus sp. 3ASR75-11]|uniref:Sporulation YhaL family protein n=1 Tax=Terrihalobacillus insolitus TaxID=2950438 RepID=A0A9X4AP06_9BACI|nr:sporulation YhaL family protein [Terrihalobacillus insolitus]MDC3415262.1 sporulation YhaL family protein [Terrihalobacillus insolitus]MDC3426354.1 sporulation YhaL family protein [Terrihalobacillus insolitus]
MILGTPWWVFMFVVFIFFSGYMAFRAFRAERLLEKQFIEREGKVYMERIEQARENKNADQKKQELVS